MAFFDRFDVCEAHFVLEMQYQAGGWLCERPSNRRRREATSIQLSRLQFRPRPSLQSELDLTENGKEIYDGLIARYSLGDLAVNS